MVSGCTLRARCTAGTAVGERARGNDGAELGRVDEAQTARAAARTGRPDEDGDPIREMSR